MKVQNRQSMKAFELCSLLFVLLWSWVSGLPILSLVCVFKKSFYSPPSAFQMPSTECFVSYKNLDAPSFLPESFLLSYFLLFHIYWHEVVHGVPFIRLVFAISDICQASFFFLNWFYCGFISCCSWSASFRHCLFYCFLSKKLTESSFCFTVSWTLVHIFLLSKRVSLSFFPSLLKWDEFSNFQTLFFKK